MDGKWLQWRTRKRVPATAVEVTAQVMYQRLVKDSLSPALRDLGFKGSGGRYSLPSSRCWAQLGLQKSAYSDAKEVQFTANLQVVNSADWAEARTRRPHLPQRPAPSTMYGADVGADTRIGSLTPDGADKWWRVYREVDIPVVVNDFIHDVREYAMPWFAEQIRTRDRQ